MLIALLATLVMANDDPDGVIATAPRSGAGTVAADAVAPVAAEVPSVNQQAVTPHGLSTDEQIDRWIASRTADARPFSDDAEPWVGDDRKVHGEVSAAVGTGDFTAYSAAVSVPIGETGRLDLSYSQSKNGWGGYGYGPYGYGPGYGYGYGYGHGWGYGPGASQTFGVRISQGRETGRDGRPFRPDGWTRERVYQQPPIAND